MMKHSFAVVLGLAFAACAFCAHAQVSSAGEGHRLVVNAGAVGSTFQPDYAGQGVAQTSPNRLDGFGAYVDADFTRWAQIEAEGRWLRWNQYAGIAQNTYMIGPRVPILDDWKGFTPYGKFLIGWGSDAGGSFSWLTARTTVWAYGGGLDYQLGRKFTLRCFDFEYQDWRVSPSLHPYGFSAGLSYRVF